MLVVASQYFALHNCDIICALYRSFVSLMSRKVSESGLRTVVGRRQRLVTEANATVKELGLTVVNHLANCRVSLKVQNPMTLMSRRRKYNPREKKI